MSVRSNEWRAPRVTLADVASHANVSRAMVSIVMRDAPGASPKTRERVLASAQALGYRPDLRARSLASQQSGLIGVMFGVGFGSFHFDLLEGLYQAAEKADQSVILTAVSKGRDEQRAVSSLQGFRLDGLIMLGPHTPAPYLAGRMPLVAVGWHVDHPEVDVVRTSDEHGMALAVEHLIGLGHRDIAHLDGGDSLVSASRRNAYRQAMRDRGLSSHARVIPGGDTQLDGQRSARHLFASGDLPSALICYNDDTAAAAAGMFMQLGVTVPGQLSLVGWDDSEVAALSPVSLTSVAQHPVEMAQRAVSRLLSRIYQQRSEEREIVLIPQIVIRDSSGPHL